MAFIQYTALIANIRGKFQGTYFRANKGVSGTGTMHPKPVTKRKIKVPDSGTNRTTQTRIRQNMLTITQSWTALTITQQRNWNAAAVDYPHTNKYGVATTLSGQQYFNLVNLRMGAYDFTQLTLSPTLGIITMPSGYNTDSSVGAMDLLIGQDAVTPVNQYMVVYMAAQRATNRAQRRRNFKYMGKLVGNDGSTLQCFDTYQSIFGTIVAGNTIDYIVYQMDSQTGEVSTPTYGTIDINP